MMITKKALRDGSIDHIRACCAAGGQFFRVLTSNYGGSWDFDQLPPFVLILNDTGFVKGYTATLNMYMTDSSRDGNHCSDAVIEFGGRSFKIV